MILGIGTDIVSLARMEIIYNKFPDVFPGKILGDKELKIFDKITLSKQKISYLSKRFAAKEAFVKALGTGFRKGIILSDVMVENDSLGKPQIIISKKIAKLLPKDAKVFLSIADEIEMAIAFVVIEN